MISVSNVSRSSGGGGVFVAQQQMTGGQLRLFITGRIKPATEAQQRTVANQLATVGVDRLRQRINQRRVIGMSMYCWLK